MDKIVKAAYDALGELISQINDFVGLDEKAKATKEHLNSLESRAKTLAGRIAEQQEAEAIRHREELEQHNKLIYNKQQEIQNLTEVTTKTKANLTGMQSALTAARTEYEAIQAQVEAIKKRLI